MDIIIKAHYSAFGRQITKKNGKTITRCPKIRRLVTDAKYNRKHRKLDARKALKAKNAERVKEYLAKLEAKKAK